MYIRPQLILRIAALLVLALLPLAAFACGDDDTTAGDDANGGERLRVVATTAQIEALTREVAGDAVELRGLLPAGADAHDFEPVASDLAAIERAQLILRHEIGLDEWLDGALGASGATVVTVTEGIELRRPALEDDHDDEDEEHADDEADDHADESKDDHGDGEYDPHVWHDPDNVKIMVDNIAAALAEADADNRETYEANAAAYKQVLDDTKREVQAIIDEIPPENRKLVTNHDAFGYFARAFGLEVVGAVIPSLTTEAEPSARQTAALLDLIREEDVKAIFAESSVNPTVAQAVARDAGVTIVDDLYADSLGEPGSGAETVHGMLLANARKIADALE